MRELEINLLLQKAEELKALFVLGQRVIPFLEEIFMFIKDITPLLDEINFSIEENLQKMPKASQQLSRVTEATEIATTEILDTLDGMSYKSDVISGNLKQMTALQAKQHHIVTSLRGIIERGEATGGGSGTVSDLISLLHSLTDQPHSQQDRQLPPVEEITPDITNLVNNSEDVLESIRMDTTQIMMALQVQDITSQQLAAVNNLLQTVQSRLGQIMVQFKGSDLGELIGATAGKGVRSAPDHSVSKISEMHRTIAFDEDAVSALDSKVKRQDMVNDIFTDFQSGATQPAQNDIDNLFAKSPSPNSSSENTASANITLNEPASADDINALFAGNTASANLNEPASADDINALFAANSSKQPTKEVVSETINETPSQDEISSIFNSVSDTPSQGDIDALFGKI
jgi:chemotaxis regulatin CheY-phosphate phosphatase CheZ